MFPLGTVLFPHTPLALRIFEQRYLMMLGRVLDDDEPSFGVVLIERGSEAGGGDQRFSVGTMARILQVDPRADDIHVVAVGGARVAVDRWLEDDPYPAASVTALPELEWNEELAPLHAQAEQIVRRVLARAAEFSDVRWDPNVELSEDPVESAWQLAALAPLGQLDQFRLLRATTLGGLLRDVIDLTLDAEVLLTTGPEIDDAGDIELDGP